MIDPGTKPEGEEYGAYNRRRWGSDGWTKSMRAMGAREGAPYANWKTWPNTTHAGRMLMRAEQIGLGDALIERLYRMCYEQGENVSLRETVARAAEEVGVPGAAAFMASDEGLAELEQQLRGAKVGGKRVSAAPTFSLRAGPAVAFDFSGAQDTAQWLSILEQCAEHAA
mmetsp:Transcript_20126/g.41067  ORF Transcript_20126/g.41067 Transcript_20126/m.41067 type:complete len:169 (+) Transcript_20126:187-693(+)